MTLADRIAILDQGRVVQFGTAEELYERPASLFVAGFIGSPKMNLLPGTGLTLASRMTVVRLGDGSLLLPRQAALPDDADRPVTLGIRPEALQPAGQGIAASVTLIESLGNIRFAYLASKASAEPLIVQLAPGQTLAEQAAVSLSATAGACHLFRADGSAFPRVAAGAGAIAARILKPVTFPLACPCAAA